MPFSQMKVQAVLLVLIAASLDSATSGSTIIKVPPIKPGVMNQTIFVNVPPTVDVKRTVQTGNDTSARLVMLPRPPPPGGDCLLSDCDENDVGCDGLLPCGPVCPPGACSRVNCTRCWQGGFSGPCCWSCCSHYMPQLAPTAPQQRQQLPFYPYPQPIASPLPQAQPMPYPQLRPIPIPYPLPQPQPFPVVQPQPIPIPQPQPFPIPQPQPIPIPQPQPIAVPQLQPIPIPQPQPFPIPQPQPIPIPQPQPIAVPQLQPIPIPQPRPVPYPISVPQPYAVPQPIPYPQFQPQPQQMQQTQAFAYMPSQCRQASNWPFLQCLPPPNCRPWYSPAPGCLPQQNWPNPCYPSASC